MKKAIALLLVLTLLLTGCSGKENAPVAETEQNTEPAVTEETLDCAGTDDMPWYNAEITDFGLELLRAAMGEEGNALLSPVSIYAALSMTANGARGDTLTQMETVLGRETEALNRWYKEDMSKSSQYLQLANILYLKDDPQLQIQESFVKTIENNYAVENYDTDVVITSFNEYTVDGINQNVADITDGMIKQIVDEIPEDALMYLVNALAFEAPWSMPYREEQVREGIFTTEQGQEQTVELMCTDEVYSYLQNELATGFMKPYMGTRYAFVALLPNEGVTVKELVDFLSGDALGDLLGDRRESLVFTTIPKFQMEFGVEMGDALQAMGMIDAFAPDKADFSNLATYNGDPVFIDRVLHKSVISFAELGTCTGTFAGVEIIENSATALDDPKEVILNRPFFYMIWDEEAHMPIFMGTFMDAYAEGISAPEDADIEIFYSPAEGPCVIVDE